MHPAPLPSRILFLPARLTLSPPAPFPREGNNPPFSRCPHLLAPPTGCPGGLRAPGTHQHHLRPHPMGVRAARAPPESACSPSPCLFPCRCHPLSHNIITYTRLTADTVAFLPPHALATHNPRCSVAPFVLHCIAARPARQAALLPSRLPLVAPGGLAAEARSSLPPPPTSTSPFLSFSLTSPLTCLLPSIWIRPSKRAAWGEPILLSLVSYGMLLWQNACVPRILAAAVGDAAQRTHDEGTTH